MPGILALEMCESGAQVCSRRRACHASLFAHSVPCLVSAAVYGDMNVQTFGGAIYPQQGTAGQQLNVGCSLNELPRLADCDECPCAAPAVP